MWKGLSFSVNFKVTVTAKFFGFLNFQDFYGNNAEMELNCLHMINQAASFSIHYLIFISIKLTHLCKLCCDFLTAVKVISSKNIDCGYNEYPQSML